MVTIELEPELADQVADLAKKRHISPEALIEEVLRTYLAQSRHEKIRTETRAFEQQLEMLLDRYPGQYVAIHEGQVIDHDRDLRTLHLRIYTHLGNTPVLLKKVTREPTRELIFRSPRFERELP